MNRKFSSLIILALMLLPSFLYSQNKTGTAGMTFLKLDVSARANAMGGAFIGLSDDASTLFYNPAGLTNLKTQDFILTHNTYLADIQFTYMGYVYPLNEYSAFGVQASYLTTGDMDETGFIENQYFGVNSGRTFSCYDMMIGASYATKLTEKFFVGGTLKFVSEGLANEQEWTIAGDVATYYDTKWKSLIFGMSIRNFGGNLEYLKEETPLPMTFIFGVGFTPIDDGVNKLHVLVEAGHPSDNGEFMILGLEYGFSDMFFLRLGRRLDGTENWFTTSEINQYADFDPSVGTGETIDKPEDEINWAGSTVGLGFKYDEMGIKVDYAFESYGYLGTTHMITLGYSLK